VERPFSYIRKDFDDLNAQLDDWLATVANVRLHGTTQRIVAEAFAAEQTELQSLPPVPFDELLNSNAASAMTAWCRSVVTTTASPIGPGASSKCISCLTRFAFWIRVGSSPRIRSWRVLSSEPMRQSVLPARQRPLREGRHDPHFQPRLRRVGRISVVATALLDRLLHHAVVIQIEGSSYRLRQHANLVPEHLLAKTLVTSPPAPKRRGRPPGKQIEDRKNG
jgi:IstB-like ATP binding protein